MFMSLIRDLSTPGEEDPISLQVVVTPSGSILYEMYCVYTIFKLLVLVSYVGWDAL